MMTNIDVKIRNPYNNCILGKIIYHQYLPMLIGISDPLGAQTDRLRCKVCQNLILSPMNTGLLRSAVATALTVYGIETAPSLALASKKYWKLQQPLPFTVLKPTASTTTSCISEYVATALTVYGIETCNSMPAANTIFSFVLQQPLPFTVLKLRRALCGIALIVALQQPLPFTVLKLDMLVQQKQLQ